MNLSTIFVSFSDTEQYQHRSRVRSAPSYDSDFDKQVNKQNVFNNIILQWTNVCTPIAIGND